MAIQPLAAPGPGQISGLPADDPIGAESWQGVELPVVERLLRDLPPPDVFTAPLGLQARLLLAPGTATLGGADFLAARVQGLLALGRQRPLRRLWGQCACFTQSI